MRSENKRVKLNELKGISNIKLCGMMCEEDIQTLNRLKPEYTGFVFWPKSSRCISKETAALFKSQLSPYIKAAGVFVDETAEKVAELINEGIIDIAQLHGSEDEAYFERLRSLSNRPFKIIKSFKADRPEELEAAKTSSADMILFDPGKGNGISFAWEILKDFERPYFLAGGLNPENAPEAVRLLHPFALDVSSGIETDKKKDKNKMEAFVKAVRGKI